MDIKKVVIPAAGIGTRFLPVTKSVPKELIPLINKPAIQFIIEEAIYSQVDNFLVIINRGKESIADYFDSCVNLDLFLKEKNKSHLTSGLEKIINSSCFSYIRQPEQLGLGHAVLMAQNFIGKEYFGIMLPDDIIFSNINNMALNQLIRVAKQEKASVIAVQEVSPALVSSYGIISIKKQITPNLFQVSNLIEKPDSKNAPSNLAIIGRYVLSNKIFDSLKEVSSIATDEIQLTDGIAHMLKNGEKVFAYKVQGIRYDIGTPIGWIKAIIGTALQNPEYAPHIRKFLNESNTLESFMFDNSKNIEHTL